MKRMLRPSIAITAALVMLLLVATLALAEERLLNGKLRTGDQVTVPANEQVPNDLYVAAGTATIDGSVEGDLVAFAGQVLVNGEIGGDLIAAGGTVTVNGGVQGDVRVAGGQVTIGGAVGEDVVASGGQLTLGSGSTVGGDLVTTGGTITVAGAVTGGIEASTGNYQRTGPDPGGEENIVRPDTGTAPQATTGDLVLDAIRHFVILLILGALALWLVPRALRASDRTLRADPLLSVAGGVATIIGYLVFIIATLLLAVLLAILFGVAQLGALAAIELVSSFLAIVVVSFLLVLGAAYFADLVVGLALGRLVASGQLTSRWQELGLLAAGAAVVVIFTSLPVIGGLAKLVVVCFGLGAIALAGWRRWRGSPPATAPAPAPSDAVPPAPA